MSRHGSLADRRVSRERLADNKANGTVAKTLAGDGWTTIRAGGRDIIARGKCKARDADMVNKTRKMKRNFLFSLFLGMQASKLSYNGAMKEISSWAQVNKRFAR